MNRISLSDRDIFVPKEREPGKFILAKVEDE